MDTVINGKANAPRILVADHKPNHLRVMCDILLEQYWLVRPVRKGAEVMPGVLNSPPDLIILDAMMPDMDGYAVCAALKENPATRHIPVIIVTEHYDRESRIKGLEAGADDFIIKPVCSTEIQMRVRNLFKVKKLWDMQRHYYANLERQVLERTAKLQIAYSNLKDAHEKLLEQEKMASLGLLMAGIAHEINNPVGFISSNLESLRKYIERFTEFIDFQDEAIKTSGITNAIVEQVDAQRKRSKIDKLLADAPELIRESVEGAEKIKLIAMDMKCFSHNDDVQKSLSDINECLQGALRIAMNEIKYKATVVEEFGEIPLIAC